MNELKVEHLSVSYGKAIALNSVDLTFLPGSVTAVVGPNGAGKSSLLLSIYGSVASVGDVLLGDVKVSGLSAIQRARHGIALVPQGRQIFPSMTVNENLEVMARLVKRKATGLESIYSRFPILVSRKKVLAGNLSGGEQQILVLARALLQEPKVLLLDEVSAGLAPRIVDLVISIAKEIADDGGTVIMAEPSTSTLRDRVDRGYVLVRGQVTGYAESWQELDHKYQTSIGIGIPIGQEDK
jgi:branched-chain amino acid transport system ATP-binding protein